MKDHRILLALVCLALSACTPAQAVTPKPTLPPPTPAPPTTVPAPQRTADPRLLRPDVSTFLAAWNSGDINAIRALYTPGATCWSASDAQALRNGASVDARVSGAAFEVKVREFGGMKLRLVGETIGVLNKLAAFAFRLEGESDGYNGVALLRYEGDHIFLHAYVVEEAITSNLAANADQLSAVDLSVWEEAWRKGADPALAQELYTEGAAVLADEDLAEVPWRDLKKPPTVTESLRQYSPWSPVRGSEALRLGDLVWFVWHWSTFTYPTGYGVRVMRMVDQRIDLDIRFAIRPWEPQGRSFVSQ